MWRDPSDRQHATLEDAVRAFVDDLTPAVQALGARSTASTPPAARRRGGRGLQPGLRLHRRRRPAHRRRAVGADRHVRAPASVRAGQGRPADVRGAQLLMGRRAHLGRTSALLDLLAAADAQDGGDRSERLARLGAHIGHVVAAPRPGALRTELAAVEVYRPPSSGWSASSDPDPGPQPQAAAGTTPAPPAPPEAEPARGPAAGGAAGRAGRPGGPGRRQGGAARHQPAAGREDAPGPGPAGHRAQPPPDLHGQPRHREDDGGPPGGPDLPDPRGGGAGPPGGGRPVDAGGRVRGPDRPGWWRRSTGPTGACCSSTRPTAWPRAATTTSARRPSTPWSSWSRTGATASWSSWPAIRTRWAPWSRPTPSMVCLPEDHPLPRLLRRRAGRHLRVAGRRAATRLDDGAQEKRRAGPGPGPGPARDSGRSATAGWPGMFEAAVANQASRLVAADTASATRDRDRRLAPARRGRPS